MTGVNQPSRQWIALVAEHADYSDTGRQFQEFFALMTRKAAKKAAEAPSTSAEAPSISAEAPPKAVAAVFAGYPEHVWARLLELRELILATAAELDGVGRLTETLKWGEPSYLTEASKSGSTIRIGWKASDPEAYAIYLNCQTTLVDTCRTRFPELIYQGNRAISFSTSQPLPRDSARECIALALTYHRDKTRRANG